MENSAHKYYVCKRVYPEKPANEHPYEVPAGLPRVAFGSKIKTLDRGSLTSYFCSETLCLGEIVDSFEDIGLASTVANQLSLGSGRFFPGVQHGRFQINDEAVFENTKGFKMLTSEENVVRDPEAWKKYLSISKYMTSMFYTGAYVDVVSTTPQKQLRSSFSSELRDFAKYVDEPKTCHLVDHFYNESPKKIKVFKNVISEAEDDRSFVMNDNGQDEKDTNLRIHPKEDRVSVTTILHNEEIPSRESKILKVDEFLSIPEKKFSKIIKSIKISLAEYQDGDKIDTSTVAFVLFVAHPCVKPEDYGHIRTGGTKLIVEAILRFTLQWAEKYELNCITKKESRAFIENKLKWTRENEGRASGEQRSKDPLRGVILKVEKYRVKSA